jgi:alkyl hydroperoxide reductase subunit F
MSAAIYAARKALDVLLVAKDLGGQITYTAMVENYLGLPNIDGKEMVEQFIMHMEQFPIAESLGAPVVQVKKENDLFTVVNEKNQDFKGKSLIYCAGKEYRRLDIPGENRFMGHGVAFCATCDAPLYSNKKVAVVGGGNSAFTSARDLLSFASEIHLIHRRATFKADPELVEEVKKAKNVTMHTNTTVVEILGKDKVTGIRIRSTDGKQHKDLVVDGVFLEIGLTPNTTAVKGLLELNKRGEIAIDKRNATSVPGFYAAGDVTDILQKQIIIAAGEGAKAALSAYSYLIDNKLIKQKAVPDSWQ